MDIQKLNPEQMTQMVLGLSEKMDRAPLKAWERMAFMKKRIFDQWEMKVKNGH